MKVRDCKNCEHCKRKTCVTYHTPNSYHAIGITHAYAYCERYKKRVSEVKICEPMGERMNKEQAFFEAQLMFGGTIKELKKQVAELQKQLEENKTQKGRLFEKVKILGKENKELKELLEEVQGQYEYECECNKQFVACQQENNSLKQQLKSQPAEIVENIKKKIEKEKDKNDLAWLGFNKLDRILDEILQEYLK